MEKDTSRQCPACGSKIPSAAPEGLCPKCLLDFDLGKGLETTIGTEGSPNDEQRNPSIERNIGPYRLVSLLAEGGMGQVYIAEQKEPIRRKVALKLIKPGMNSKEVLARFKAESQAVAMMDHTNIARIFDAGTTDDGQPFFVMEFVEGKPLTEFCDEHGLSLHERLALFRQVCQAVQHAHQKGIIHRDLKPSNILVTTDPENGNAPIPKVIDFGVAKALGPELTENTLQTLAGQILGTPQYMSPEQASLDGLDIDTRSDIYSLGVILYELLTGRTPLEFEELRRQGLGAILQAIREQEAPRPSTKLSSIDPATLTSIAAVRKVPLSRFTQTLRGDLDWIVLKALEKNRERRYETATAFAEDIARYCADEPVSATPPSYLYQLRKFARRNRSFIGAATGVVLALIAGLLASLYQARIANEQFNRANEVSLRLREESGRRWLAAARNATITLQGEEGRSVVAPVFPDMPIMAAKAFGFTGFGRPWPEEIKRFPEKERAFWEVENFPLLDPDLHPIDFAEARQLLHGGFRGAASHYFGMSREVRSLPIQPIWTRTAPPFSPATRKLKLIANGSQLLVQRISWEENPSSLSLWDLETGELLKSEANREIIGFDVDSSRDRLALLFRETWEVWNLSDWPDQSPVVRFPMPHAEPYNSVVLVPGSDLACLFADDSGGPAPLAFVDVTSGEAVEVPIDNIEEVERVAVSENGSSIAMQTSSSVEILKRASSEWTRRTPLRGRYQALALSPDGDLLIASTRRSPQEKESGAPNLLQGWTLSSPSHEEVFSNTLDKGWVQAISVVDDGRFVTQSMDSSSEEVSLETRNRETGAVIDTISRRKLRTSSISRTEIHCSDGRIAAANSVNNSDNYETGWLDVIDLERNRVLAKNDEFLGKRISARFSPDGTQFLLCSRGRLQAFDSETKGLLWERSSSGEFRGVAYEPHARGLITIESEAPGRFDIRRIDIDSGEELEMIFEGFEYLNSIDACIVSSDGDEIIFSESGTNPVIGISLSSKEVSIMPASSPSKGGSYADILVAGLKGFMHFRPGVYDSGVHFLSPDADDNEAWTNFEGDVIDFPVISAQLHPLTRQIVIGGSKFVGRGESVAGRVEIRDFTGELYWSQQFAESVSAVAFSPDGSDLYVGTESGKIWVINQLAMYVVNTHGAAVKSIDCHPSGGQVLSLDAEGVAKVWLTDPPGRVHHRTFPDGGYDRSRLQFSRDKEWLVFDNLSFHLPSREWLPLPPSVEFPEDDDASAGPKILSGKGNSRTLLARALVNGNVVEAVAEDDRIKVFYPDQAPEPVSEFLIGRFLPFDGGRRSNQRGTVAPSIYGFEFSPDGNCGAFLVSGAVHLWRFSDGKISSPLFNVLPAEACRFSQDGSLIALWGGCQIARQVGRRQLSLWDVEEAFRNTEGTKSGFAPGMFRVDNETFSIEQKTPIRILSDSHEKAAGKSTRGIEHEMIVQRLRAHAHNAAFLLWQGMEEGDKKESVADLYAGLLRGALRHRYFATYGSEEVFPGLSDSHLGQLHHIRSNYPTEVSQILKQIPVEHHEWIVGNLLRRGWEEQPKLSDFIFDSYGLLQGHLAKGRDIDLEKWQSEVEELKARLEKEEAKKKN